MQSIDQMAQDWSSTMYSTGNFEHRSNISGPVPGNWSGVGENIIYWSGYNCDVVADGNRAVNNWMNSPGHRQNILNPQFTHVGYGFISGSSSNRTYGTQNFARYESSNAPPAAASISISPSQGAPGTSVSVSGQGYPAGFRVNILFGPSERYLGSVTTNSNGSFNARVTVPSVSGGAYTIRARVDDGVIHRDSVFRVQVEHATLRLSPTTVGPAGVVAFSGTNFQPGERVDLRWGSAYGDIIGYVTANSNGSVNGRVTVRATMSGTYRIVARGTSSHKAIGANVVVNGVDPGITVSPSVTGAGTVVGVTGQGFAPWETVHITWNTHTGRVLGVVRASADGTIGGRITIPADANGTYNVYARGQTSYVTVRQRVAVTSTRAQVAMEAPQISLSQSGLTMGESTTLTGRGFQPGEDVTLTTSNDVDLITITVGEDGRFTTDVTIPDPVAYADQEQRMRAVGAESERDAETPFSITDWDRADIQLTPAEGPVGTITTVSASGFVPGEGVQVTTQTSAGPVLAEGTADEQGNIAIEVTIPDGTAGEPLDLIVASSDGTRLGKGTFRIGEESIATPGITPDQATPQPDESEEAQPPATPTSEVTPEPTEEMPVETQTEIPTEEPPATPTETSTEIPTEEPTETPTEVSTEVPTEIPTEEPTEEPAEEPTAIPTEEPTDVPTNDPPESDSGTPAA